MAQLRAAGAAPTAEWSVVDAHETVYSLLAQGRATSPLSYWRHAIERAGIKLPDPSAKPEDGAIYKKEQHGKYGRVTGGKVKDPEAFADVWAAAGWIDTKGK